MAIVEPEDTAETLEEEKALWRALRSGGDATVRTRLIEMHLPFARIMAGKLFARRMHDEIEFGEYLQLASIGLIECVDRYDPDRGASFRTYSSRRLTGAVLDGIVKLTEKQEQIAFRQRVRAERTESLKEDSGIDSSDPQQLFEALARVAVGLAVGYLLEDSGMYRAEERAAPDRGYQAIELRQLQERVRELVETLPEREGRIIRMHYLHLIAFEAIADALGISKGRVSQLHRRAIGMLRDETRKVERCDIAW
jgi:RNA polymerase sigma factor for flagellar operon FliA